MTGRIIPATDEVRSSGWSGSEQRIQPLGNPDDIRTALAAMVDGGQWAIITHAGRRYLVELAPGARYTFTSEFTPYGDPARPPRFTDLKLTGRVAKTWPLPKGTN